MPILGSLAPWLRESLGLCLRLLLEALGGRDHAAESPLLDDVVDAQTRGAPRAEAELPALARRCKRHAWANPRIGIVAAASLRGGAGRRRHGRSFREREPSKHVSVSRRRREILLKSAMFRPEMRITAGMQPEFRATCCGVLQRRSRRTSQVAPTFVFASRYPTTQTQTTVFSHLGPERSHPRAREWSKFDQIYLSECPPRTSTMLPILQQKGKGWSYEYFHGVRRPAPVHIAAW